MSSSLAPPLRLSLEIKKKSSFFFRFTFHFLLSSLSLSREEEWHSALSILCAKNGAVSLRASGASAGRREPLLGVAAMLNDNANSSSLVVAVTAAGGGVSIVDGKSQVRLSLLFPLFSHQRIKECVSLAVRVLEIVESCSG